MAASSEEPEEWYWCLRHRRPERASTSRCPAGVRLGPYESAEDAERWRERVEARNRRWEQQEKEWTGAGEW